MNPHLFSALEKIKTGDLKSAMDQAHFLCSQLSLVQQDILNLYKENETKVALESRMQDGLSTVSKLGTGIISSIGSGGTVLNGTGTLFTKETAIGNTIKIGNETTIVTGFDVTTPDTKMIVNPAVIGTYENQIYAIIKPSTKEVLTGDFNFGILNGLKFNGNIAKDSTFEHRGRMTNPADLVNVSFVQKAVNPVMVRAQNAIQRDGDIVQGTGDSRFTYNFDYTDITFDIHSDVRYLGSITHEDNLATVRMLTNTNTDITTLYEPSFATWERISSTGTNITVGSQTIKCRFLAGVYPSERTSNFLTLFDVLATGIRLKANVLPQATPPYTGIVITVSVAADYQHNLGIDNYGIQCGIYKNSILLAATYNYEDGNTDFHANPGSSVTATLILNPGDTLVVGALCDGLVPTTSAINHSLSITKIGFCH